MYRMIKQLDGVSECSETFPLTSDLRTGWSNLLEGVLLKNDAIKKIIVGH